MTWEPTPEEIHAYTVAARAEHRRATNDPAYTGMDYVERRDQIAAAGLRAAYTLLQQRVGDTA